MTDSSPKPSREADDDRLLERLFQVAGERETAPDLTRERVRRETRAAWRAQVQLQRARQEARHPARADRRRGWALAAAAGLTGIILLGLMWSLWAPSPEPAVWVASRESGKGTPTYVPPDLETLDSEPDLDRIYTGAEWKTGSDARVALRLATDEDRRRLSEAGSGAELTATGAVVRLAGDSHLRLIGPGELTLLQGRVYVDTRYGGAPAGLTDGHGAITVHTPLGMVQDVGTEFAVSIDDRLLRVQVREGRVQVIRDGREHLAAAGTTLALDDEGHAQRQATASHGTAWQWVVEAAPKLDPTGRTVAEILTWVSEETGWRVQWQDPDLERSAADIRVQGNPGPLSPDQAPAVVLPGAGLAFEVTDGVLRVTRPTDD